MMRMTASIWLLWEEWNKPVYRPVASARPAGRSIFGAFYSEPFMLVHFRVMPVHWTRGHAPISLWQKGTGFPFNARPAHAPARSALMLSKQPSGKIKVLYDSAVQKLLDRDRQP